MWHTPVKHKCTQTSKLNQLTFLLGNIPEKAIFCQAELLSSNMWYDFVWTSEKSKLQQRDHRRSVEESVLWTKENAIGKLIEGWANINPKRKSNSINKAHTRATEVNIEQKKKQAKKIQKPKDQMMSKKRGERRRKRPRKGLGKTKNLRGYQSSKWHINRSRGNRFKKQTKLLLYH